VYCCHLLQKYREQSTAARASRCILLQARASRCVLLGCKGVTPDGVKALRACAPQLRDVVPAAQERKALPAELPVGELRAELVARHLPTHGLRAELVGRLEEDIAAESATPARDIYTTGAAAAAATGYSFS
jgi:hypothetical protein